MSTSRTTTAVAVAAFLAIPLAAVASPSAQAGVDAKHPHHVGAVYVLSNQVAGNSVIAYDRNVDGTLTPAGEFPTGGTGTGGGLGSQGAVVLDESGKHLYAVNAGSDSITSFAVTRHGLQALSTVPSGGDMPVSVGVRGNRLYALNAGGAGNVSGFRVHRGWLTPKDGSTRLLSGDATAPAQVSIAPDGDALIVTEKATGLIDVYDLNRWGWATTLTSVPSSGATPFGFAFTPSGKLAVSEAGPSAATTYAVSSHGLRTISASVANTEAAACWLVVTENGRFAYTGNGGGSLSISGYNVGRGGSLSLFDDGGKTGTAAGGVSEIDLSDRSEFLYARLGDGTVGAYDVKSDGTLTPLPVGTGLPAGAVGIAAN